jgi:NAD(P)-dependent dehydrogenase (short-subunit alcohol dehydrogenase family)
MRVLVTGATDGIGAEAVKLLAQSGAQVVAHGRDAAKVARAGGEGVVADLSSLAETARLAEEIAVRWPELDVLVNNAGIGFGADPRRRETSRDGFELRLAVNYLAPYLLTELLLAHGVVRRAVVNVASGGQEDPDPGDLDLERGYSGMSAYCRSKLAMIMHTFDIAESHAGVAANALHPGTFLDTKMVREGGIAPRGPASRGAAAIAAVIEASLAGTTATYFDETRPARALPAAYDRAARARLRAATEARVAPFRSR